MKAHADMSETPLDIAPPAMKELFFHGLTAAPNACIGRADRQINPDLHRVQLNARSTSLLCVSRRSGRWIAREGARHRSGAAVDLEAFEDVLDVLAYGVLGEVDLSGDLPVGQTGCDVAESLTLPSCQRRCARVTELTLAR